MALSYFGRNKATLDGETAYDPVRIDGKYQDRAHRRAADKNALDSEKQAPLSDSDSGMSIGAQIDSEKSNAIQYRTCGWKKV